MATLRSEQKLAALRQKYHRNVRGTANHGTRQLLDLTRHTSDKFLKLLGTKPAKTFPWTLKVKFPHLSCSASVRRISLDPTDTSPGTSQNTDVENQEPTMDRSQNGRHSEKEASVYHSRNSNDLDQDEASHKCRLKILNFELITLNRLLRSYIAIKILSTQSS